MQAYGAAFARVYNLLWTGFARDIAARLLDFSLRQETSIDARLFQRVNSRRRRAGLPPCVYNLLLDLKTIEGT